MPTERTTVPLPLTPAPASADDAADILRLRNQLVDWMQDRTIAQWRHDDVSVERIRQQAEDGEWWLVRSGGTTLDATIRTLSDDPQMWGSSDRRALYVHGLMVDRSCAGQGLGSRLLNWAAVYGRGQGAEVLRLDCVASNPDLCSYYLREGFTRVGTKELPQRWCNAALFERPT